jgi:hypothetical protein
MKKLAQKTVSAPSLIDATTEYTFDDLPAKLVQLIDRRGDLSIWPESVCNTQMAD